MGNRPGPSRKTFDAEDVLQGTKFEVQGGSVGPVIADYKVLHESEKEIEQGKDFVINFSLPGEVQQADGPQRPYLLLQQKPKMYVMAGDIPELEVFLNGHRIFSLPFGIEGYSPGMRTILFDGNLFDEDENTLKFSVNRDDAVMLVQDIILHFQRKIQTG
jgi:hypothetical protein